MKRVLLSLLICLLLMLAMVGCESKDDDKLESVRLSLILTGPRYQGDYYASFLQVTTDYAIWVEDASRNFVKTLQITPVAVTVSAEQGSHLEHLPAWAESADLTYADLEAETAAGVPASFDGLTSASPFFSTENTEDTLIVCWDLTDVNGQEVELGIYYICVEAANITKEGDSDTGTVTNFEINTETLSMEIDLTDQTYTTGTPTTNLTGMSAEFVSD
jgi:hypothetical protein